MLESMDEHDGNALIKLEEEITHLSHLIDSNSKGEADCEWIKWERLSNKLRNALTDSNDIAFLKKRLCANAEFSHLSDDEFYNIAPDFELVCIDEPHTLIYEQVVSSHNENQNRTDTMQKRHRSPLSLTCNDNEGREESNKDAHAEPALFEPNICKEMIIVVIVMGDVKLQFGDTTENKCFVLPPYTTIISNYLERVYPHSARITSISPCWLLVLRSNHRERLRNTLVTMEHSIISKQEQFLRDMLKVKLFEHTCSNNCFDDPNTDNKFCKVITECAKELLPLHLNANQYLYNKGERADYLYFVAMGTIKLSREVKREFRPITSTESVNVKRRETSLLDDLSLLTNNICNNNNTSQYNNEGCCSSTKSNNNNNNMDKTSNRRMCDVMHVVDVAKLTCGEMCGEIGLTACDIDFRPAINVVWTDSYWSHRLETGNNDFNKNLIMNKTANSDESDSAAQSSDIQEENGDIINGCKAAREVIKVRVMSATATEPSLVYALSYENCKRFFPQECFTRLHEYVKGYPSYDDLLTISNQQREWLRFKHNVSYNIEKNVQQKTQYKATSLPPMTF